MAEDKKNETTSPEERPDSSEDKMATKPQASWWRDSKAGVPILVAAIALVPPMTSALYAHISGEQNLDLAAKQHEAEQKLAQQTHDANIELAKNEQKANLDLTLQRQNHEIRSFYFKLAVAPDSTIHLRQRVLRYLRNDPDQALAYWAENELTEVEELLEKEKEIAALRQDLDASIRNVADNEDERKKFEQAEQSLRTKIRHLQNETKALLSPSGKVDESPLDKQERSLRCVPGTTAMEFHPREEAHRCGKPTDRAYLDSVTGNIYWTLSIDGERVTCFCRPL